MKKIFSALTFLMLTSSAIAEPKEDGNVWHSMCNSADTKVQANCGMFVTGFLYGITAQSAITNTQRAFCFPEGGAYLQAHDVFAKYLRDHPEKRHLHGATLLLVSLKEAFPCKQM